MARHRQDQAIAAADPPYDGMPADPVRAGLVGKGRRAVLTPPADRNGNRAARRRYAKELRRATK